MIANKNLHVKVGTSENRDAPQTVYAEISFWVEIKDKNIKGSILRTKMDRYLHDIYKHELTSLLETNDFFPCFKENIFVVNIPENINYNDKLNFVSVELYLHTLNINSEKKYSLNNKKNTELFDEMIRIINKLGASDVLNDHFEFNIKQKVKRK